MRWLTLLLALLLSGPAWADIPLLGAGGTSGIGYIGPGDLVSGASGWYSCARGYSGAYVSTGTAKACNLRNVVSGETCDEMLTTGGKPDSMANCSLLSNGASLATFCTGGCAVAKMYDQTGNSHDIVQATTANQPLLTVSCLGGLPCILLANLNTITLASASNFTPATGTVSFSIVAQRSVGTGGVQFLGESSNRIQTSLSASTWSVFGTSGFNVTASDVVWHHATGVVNGASSSGQIDATRSTGTTGALLTTAGKITISGPAAASTMIETEAGFWDNLAFTSGQQTSLCKNAQTAYGGGGNFGAAC